RFGNRVPRSRWPGSLSRLPPSPRPRRIELTGSEGGHITWPTDWEGIRAKRFAPDAPRPAGRRRFLPLTAPLVSPSLFSVRAPRRRARGRHEGLQANSRQRSARASSYGVLPRSDPQGRDTYTTWTLKQPSRLHLRSRTYPTRPVSD